MLLVVQLDRLVVQKNHQLLKPLDVRCKVVIQTQGGFKRWWFFCKTRWSNLDPTSKNISLTPSPLKYIYIYFFFFKLVKTLDFFLKILFFRPSLPQFFWTSPKNVCLNLKKMDIFNPHPKENLWRSPPKK